MQPEHCVTFASSIPIYINGQQQTHAQRANMTKHRVPRRLRPPLSISSRRHVIQLPKCCTTPSSSFASMTESQTNAVEKLCSSIAQIAGPERGIFGMEDEDRELLEQLIQTVEKETPVKRPTADNAAAAHGRWRLLYTTLQILGRRRIKLGIATGSKSGLVKLGELEQVVDSSTCRTSNIVYFDVMGMVKGTFQINADYTVSDTEDDDVNKRRVQVTTRGTILKPESLQKMLGKNEKLLTDIFNPQGILDITYLDGTIRIGRDGKGQVFVLEKVSDEAKVDVDEV